jgi:hypothetical protein
VHNLVITWPKRRSLESYLDGCKHAEENGLQINFRIAKPPARKVTGARVFVVHDAYIRGFHTLIEVVERGENEVAIVNGDAFAGFWPAGWYLVRDPTWHPIVPIPMKGFQGWRYA